MKRICVRILNGIIKYNYSNEFEGIGKCLHQGFENNEKERKW